MASSYLLFWLVGLLLLYGSVAAAPAQGQVANEDDKVAPQVNVMDHVYRKQQQH